MEITSFHLTVQGADHIKRGKECQDHSSSVFDTNSAVAIVCDGHGGNDYIRSAQGAAFAGTAAMENIRKFMEQMDKTRFFQEPQEHLRRLEASIISDWNHAVCEHYREHPFTESEFDSISEKAKRKYKAEGRVEIAYGTTLLAAAVTEDYWFGIQIGDGRCVVFPEKEDIVQPIPWDEACFLNATTSLCDSDALHHFRHFYSEELPAAIFLGSDGVDDCFQNDEQFYQLYRTALSSFQTMDFEKAVEELWEYLPRLSEKGSGDDISISGILDMEEVTQWNETGTTLL